MSRRVGLFLAFLLAASLSIDPAAGATAPRTFTFHGAGYGHGLGLSQWGGYGMAQQGKTYRQILAHFYRGTRVAPASKIPSVVRVGLTQGRKLVHLGAVGGRVELRLQGGGHIAWIPSGAIWTVTATTDGRFSLKDASGSVVGGGPWGSVSKGLVADPSEVVKVTETGHSYERGTIQLDVYRPCGGCAFRERMIGVLGPEFYLHGIGEVPSGWPMQSLEAQAVAARTYAFEKIGRLGQHRSGCNCALYASTLDQNYVGWDKENGYLGERWVQAVIATRNQVATYKGALIQAYYHASSGGFTENNENVWGGSPIPYLRGVCDPGDYTSANAVRTWSVTFTDAALTKKLASLTGSIGTVTGFSDAVRGVSGRIRSMTVMGTAGKATVSGSALRSALGLRDTRVWVNSNRNVTGAIRERYDELMCAPGAAAGPQRTVPGGRRQVFARGAMYRNASNGHVIWLRGAMYAKYVDLGDAGGKLGIPVSGTRTLTLPRGCKTFACSMTRFVHGGIYLKSSSSVGIHELHGALYWFFRSLGGVRGSLGFPTSDVKGTSSGGTTASFEHGRITCSAKGICSKS